MPTNSEGLTFAEWLAASGCTGKVDDKELRGAWRRGEDHTEWRAHGGCYACKTEQQGSCYEESLLFKHSCAPLDGQFVRV